MIELQHVTKIFQQSQRHIKALDDVSLFIPEGKIVGVIGESGAGKSTLIRVVNLLDRPTEGRIIVDGQDLMSLSDSQLAKSRRNIGMIFQHFNLLSSRTVFDNVALPLELDNTPKEERSARVTELLKLVGLEEKTFDYPSKLSGGQKQRVAIARTLATQPKVLLCDEATSALDPATTRSILSLLKEINQQLNITILLITHEMDVVKEICDDVAVISDGRLIEQGSVADIFSHPKEKLTKQFIASSLHMEIPADYQDRLTESQIEGKHSLLWIEFSGNSVDAPVLSEVARRFEINSNIINARMDYIGGLKFGVMLVEFISSVENENNAIEFLKTQNIKVEVLGYV